MSRLDVQGIVSYATDEPLVQFRQLDDDGKLVVGWQMTIMEAREIAQHIVEAAANAIYDAALVGWVKEKFPEQWEEVSATMLIAMRNYRADKWGLPDMPDDWSKD